jgi:hypothetical protein
LPRWLKQQQCQTVQLVAVAVVVVVVVSAVGVVALRRCLEVVVGWSLRRRTTVTTIGCLRG